MKARVALFLLVFFVLAHDLYQYFLVIAPRDLLTSCVSAPVKGFDFNATIGAYYQTSSNHVLASKLALSLFKKMYAFAPIFLYVDRPLQEVKPWWLGYDFLTLIPFDSASKSSENKGTHFATIKACSSYLKRIILAAQNVDWLILLEDDVWTCGSVDFSELTHDMNGQCVAEYNSHWGDSKPGACYGGYGGFILRGQFLREELKIDRAYIGKILAQLKRPVASDELLSAVFLKSNGTIGRYPGYAEKMGESPVIVHQMKGFYKD